MDVVTRKVALGDVALVVDEAGDRRIGADPGFAR
jgi:hypothetical protein